MDHEAYVMWMGAHKKTKEKESFATVKKDQLPNAWLGKIHLRMKAKYHLKNRKGENFYYDAQCVFGGPFEEAKFRCDELTYNLLTLEESITTPVVDMSPAAKERLEAAKAAYKRAIAEAARKIGGARRSRKRAAANGKGGKKNKRNKKNKKMKMDEQVNQNVGSHLDAGDVEMAEEEERKRDGEGVKQDAKTELAKKLKETIEKKEEAKKRKEKAEKEEQEFTELEQNLLAELAKRNEDGEEKDVEEAMEMDGQEENQNQLVPDGPPPGDGLNEEEEEQQVVLAGAGAVEKAKTPAPTLPNDANMGANLMQGIKVEPAEKEQEEKQNEQQTPAPAAGNDDLQVQMPGVQLAPALPQGNRVKGEVAEEEVERVPPALANANAVVNQEDDEVVDGCPRSTEWCMRIYNEEDQENVTADITLPPGWPWPTWPITYDSRICDDCIRYIALKQAKEVAKPYANLPADGTPGTADESAAPAEGLEESA